MRLPCKINAVGFIKTDISIFKIYGSELESMVFTPQKTCIIDFGDGIKQTYEGTKKSTVIEHTYDVEGEYTIKIIGNHSTFQASKNVTEAIQLSSSLTSCYKMFQNCTNLHTISPSLKIPNNKINSISNMFERMYKSY